MKVLNNFERKHPRFGIPNLMTYIVIGMLFVYVFDLLAADASLSSILYFNRALILEGEVWRIITFIFLPPSSSPLFMVFALYFSYMIGASLEAEWGSCIFSAYYIIGIIGNIAAGFITGFAENTYLNLSLFFAFAILFPNFQLTLFFVLPIKIKYLAVLDAMFFIVSFILGGWSSRASLIASIINLIIFFSGTMINGIKQQLKYRKVRANFRQQSRMYKQD